MTVVAYRDGVMAADTEAQQYGLRAGYVRKIYRAPDGALLSSHGGHTDAEAFKRWFCADCPRDDRPTVGNGFLALVVMTNGDVRQYDDTLNWGAVVAPFFVLGSGGAVAFGAMAFGASAIEAVQIAIQYDVGCGGTIQIEALGSELAKAAE